MFPDASSGELMTENSTIIEYQNLIQSLNEINSVSGGLEYTQDVDQELSRSLDRVKAA